MINKINIATILFVASVVCFPAQADTNESEKDRDKEATIMQDTKGMDNDKKSKPRPWYWKLNHKKYLYFGIEPTDFA